MNTTYNIQNSPVVADIAMSARQLSIAGGPTMNYLGIQGAVVTRSQPERAAVKTITVVLGNNTLYRFEVSQILNGQTKTGLVNYTSSAVATTNTTEISLALKAQLDAQGFGFTTVATSDTVLTVTASAGSPIFYMSNLNNTVIVAAMPTISPNGTAALAILNTFAPHGTAATAIAGTTTVTVTTLAAHGLNVGDQVTIAGVATMTINGASSGTFYIATVPTSTTFTLYSCTGSGTNTGTITITGVNTVVVNTLAAHGLVAGDHITVSSIATLTVNGAASFTGRVRSAVSTTQVIIDEVTSAGSANTGTIVITTVAQTAQGQGTDLDGIDGIVSGNTYTLFDFIFANPSAYLNLSAEQLILVSENKLYVNEGAATYPAYYTRLNEKINAYLAFSTTFDPSCVSL